MGVSIVTHLVKGLDYEECILAIVLMTQLLIMRKEFTARSDRPSIAQGIRHFGAALLFTLMYGSAGFYILDGHFSVHQGEKLIQHYNFGVKAAIVQTFELFFATDNVELIPETIYASLFVNSIYIVGSLTIFYALGMLLQ